MDKTRYVTAEMQQICGNFDNNYGFIFYIYWHSSVYVLLRRHRIIAIYHRCIAPLNSLRIEIASWFLTESNNKDDNDLFSTRKSEYFNTRRMWSKSALKPVASNIQILSLDESRARWDLAQQGC